MIYGCGKVRIQASRFALCLLLALRAFTASAADALQNPLLSDLVDKVDLRYSQQIFALALLDQRGNSAAQLLEGMGKGAKLPESWRRGNPHWERAYARLGRSIDEEEARGGPLFVISKADFLASFNPPWSNEEIESLIQIAATDYGRSYVRVMDLMLAPVFVRQFSSMKDISVSAVTRLRQVENEGKKEFGPRMLELMELEKANNAAAVRVKELTGRINEAEGRKIGESMMKPSVARLLNAMYACMADLLGIIEDYRHTISNPANRL